MHLERKTMFELLKCPYFFPGAQKFHNINLFLLPFVYLNQGQNPKFRLLLPLWLQKGTSFLGPGTSHPLTFQKI